MLIRFPLELPPTEKKRPDWLDAAFGAILLVVIILVLIFAAAMLEPDVSPNGGHENVYAQP